MSNLFKKAAIFTDLHIGLKSNSVVHNEDCIDFVRWFIKTAKENNCETCFFLGDWHHNRATINIQSLHYSLQCLELLNDSFEQVFFIAGNHDQFFRDKRDINSVAWAKHLKNVTIINDFFIRDDVVIAPWLVGNEWKRIPSMTGKYMFGHFELPHFFMNALVEMPDHGELQENHMSGFDHVFSGHFHKRQVRTNVTYVGNAFPHNFADVNDDARGMMTLDWDGTTKFFTWDNQPTFRVYKLSSILDDSDKLLKANSHVRVNLDIDISFEESNFIKEQLMPKYNLRELALIPMKIDLSQDDTDYSNIHIESVDSIVIGQIEQLQQGSFDKQLLLEIYRNI
jgi:DNA repair exonuclease SbcCD nuclease subunit